MHIHKAVRPKKDYVNPTRCSAMYLSEESAHRNSRVSWDKVTCPKCLKHRRKK